MGKVSNSSIDSELLARYIYLVEVEATPKSSAYAMVFGDGYNYNKVCRMERTPIYTEIQQQVHNEAVEEIASIVYKTKRTFAKAYLKGLEAASKDIDMADGIKERSMAIGSLEKMLKVPGFNKQLSNDTSSEPHQKYDVVASGVVE